MQPINAIAQENNPDDKRLKNGMVIWHRRTMIITMIGLYSTHHIHHDVSAAGSQ